MPGVRHRHAQTSQVSVRFLLLWWTEARMGGGRLKHHKRNPLVPARAPPSGNRATLMHPPPSVLPSAVASGLSARASYSPGLVAAPATPRANMWTQRATPAMPPSSAPADTAVPPRASGVTAGGPAAMCGNCDDVPAATTCGACGQIYCAQCDAEMHAPQKMAGHKRVPLRDDPAAPGAAGAGTDLSNEAAHMPKLEQVTSAHARARVLSQQMCGAGRPTESCRAGWRSKSASRACPHRSKVRVCVRV